MRAHLVKVMYVEAAHRNPLGSAAQQRLHGHSYRIEVLASGAPDAQVGWVVDFAELKHLFAPLYARLDHACLNDLPGLEVDSTLPGLRRWIVERLQPVPVWLEGVRVSIVGDLRFAPRRLAEDPARGLPERIAYTFEAAQSLPHLPVDHHCRKIHGHSYRMEVGARNLDPLQTDLEALYQAFDHRYLNDVPGLEIATCEFICEWVWGWLQGRDHTPTVVLTQETETSQCLYFGENAV
ncbi:MAG: 6-carboxytetrahydropterin synthase [Candidatus Hydrogenedentes bacterium]|nr:6-carboxytetrahydropterin synthase [Candidatus Hydrogenedentota bacterium]